MFDAIQGHERIKRYLSQAVEKKQLPHALLFAGPDGVGKFLVAKTVAAYLLQTPLARIEKENHPDLHIVRPTGKSGLHAIETLRQLIDQVHEAPFEAPAKVFVICNAERMQPPAANALLKILEEPQPDTTLILLSAHPKELIPTILSRCIQLSFQHLSEPDIALLLAKRGVSERFAKLGQGSVGKAIELAKGPPLEDNLLRLLETQILYPDLLKALEAIEASIESEDPIELASYVERLFSAILFWRRDQEARAIGMPSSTLFFPDAPLPNFPLKPLAVFQRAFNEALLASERNMKLSLLLEKLIHSMNLSK